jgi:tetratricopeptide (TPR) repeat protein
MKSNKRLRDGKGKVMKLHALAIFVFSVVLMATNLFADREMSDSHVREAWEAWERNDQQEVENKFKAAIEADDQNTKAYLGLSYLYCLQEKYEDSWKAFEKILHTEENFYPYIFAAWLTPPIRLNFMNHKKYIIDLFEELSEEADAEGVIKAQACEDLANYYQAKRDFSKSRKFHQEIGAVKDWMIIGPFDNISATGYDKEYPPETGFDPDTTYEGKNGIPAEWFEIETFPNVSWINFMDYFDHYHSIFYANNFVYSDERQFVQIRMGTSGSFKTFLNDELIIGTYDENNNDLDTYIAETELQAGWNRVLIKCGFSEIENCNFLLRITDDRGENIEGLKVSTDVQSYRKHPGSRVKLVDDASEDFFKRKMEEYPEHLENYLLLADLYLRNDRAIEAELVMRDAIKLSPNCALLYRSLMEAFIRGEKTDEFETTCEKIYSLDKSIPDGLRYKIYGYIETEDYDKAEELIRDLEKLIPESESIYETYLYLYREKKQLDKMIEINSKAYEQYPRNWRFVAVEASIPALTAHQYDRSIDIVSDYLKYNYSEGALFALQRFYLEASNIGKWRETWDKLLELSPASSIYYYTVAWTYYTLQDYTNAEEMIKKALDTNPGSTLFWEVFGDILRIRGAAEKAERAYEKALRYSPVNYDAREKLRELEGKESIYNQFETVEIAELISSAPGHESYPDDDAVILLYDVKRVVYEKGASESSVEMLIKVFNKDGIDDFKERWIDYNYYTETLTIEKAVVLKADGAEIKADISDNYLVFKSLEENDLMHIKWRVKNYYSGRLSNHFWDTFFFNRFYPQKIVRYGLLAPSSAEFRYRTFNIPAEPVMRETENGIIYQWTLHDEPAVEYEYGMPVLDDVGKVLYISSIPDWKYIVDWYTDLAQTKARSSYEIKEKMEELLADKGDCTEEDKIKIIYEFITENIHYSSVSFRQSALIPQKARDVLVSKMGDCKDVTTLGISMLNEAGIDAHYILLNTRDNGLNRNILPSIYFNHVIAGIETGDGLKYVDFSTYNYPLGSLPRSELEAFILPIKPGVEAPVYLPRSDVEPNNIYRKCEVDILEDNSIVARSTSIRTGIFSAQARYSYRHEGQKEREKKLSEGLSSYYPNLEVTRFEIEDLDNLEPEVRYMYDYNIPNYLSETGQFLLFKVPWEFIYEAQPSLSYAERTYPLNFWSSVDTLIEEVHVNLPDGYEPVELEEDSNVKSEPADYYISYSYSNGVLQARKELIFKKLVIYPEEYKEFKQFYNDVVNNDVKQILLRKRN